MKAASQLHAQDNYRFVEPVMNIVGVCDQPRYVRGVVNKFPDGIFRARTKCGYHTNCYRYYSQIIMG